MQLSRLSTKTANVTSRNLGLTLLAFLHLASWLFIKTRLLLHCPLRSNVKPKTIAALNLTQENQIVERSRLLLQAFPMLGSQILLTSPSLPHLVNCASGTVSHWGRDYVLVTQMLKAFREQFPKLQELPDHDIPPVLLTARNGEASFLRYAPTHASESLKRALRTWYDKKEFKKYRTEKPPDFC
jgi:hypothetical protein